MHRHCETGLQTGRGNPISPQKRTAPHGGDAGHRFGVTEVSILRRTLFPMEEHYDRRHHL